MQAIVTKFIGYTTTKPSRIKAYCSRGSITVSKDSLDGNDEEQHIAAAKKLIAKFIAEDIKREISHAEKNPWNKSFVTGQLPDGNFVHVFSLIAWPM